MRRPNGPKANVSFWVETRHRHNCLARHDFLQPNRDMDEGIGALSERERETLRLLLVGHDAKSIARRLGLSVHTINERLRDARRKMGVSSSREAARLLVEAEAPSANSLADKELGVAPVVAMPRNAPLDQGDHARHSLGWFGVGLLIMSLVMAALIFSSHPSEASKNEPISAPDTGLALMEKWDGKTLPQQVEAMASDVSKVFAQQPPEGPNFASFMAWQVYRRQLSEAVIFKLTRDNHIEALETVNFDTGALLSLSRHLPAHMPIDYKVMSFSTENRRGAVVRLYGSDNTFLAVYRRR